MKSLVSWAGCGCHGKATQWTMVQLGSGAWPGLSVTTICVCVHIHPHTHMRHRRTQFIIKYLAYFAARLRASAYYNNISGQLPACPVAVGDKNP